MATFEAQTSCRNYDTYRINAVHLASSNHNPTSVLARIGWILWQAMRRGARDEACRIQVRQSGDDLLSELAQLSLRGAELVESAKRVARTYRFSTQEEYSLLEGSTDLLPRARDLEQRVWETARELACCPSCDLKARSGDLASLAEEIGLLAAEIADLEAFWAGELASSTSLTAA